MKVQYTKWGVEYEGELENIIEANLADRKGNTKRAFSRLLIHLNRKGLVTLQDIESIADLYITDLKELK